MQRVPRLLAAGLAALAVTLEAAFGLPAGTTAWAASDPPAQPTISLDEIRPGMKGYGLTVFQGTKPERFDVRVVGILHNFLPKQDIILIRSDDARLKHTGVVAGMSGSPIYLEGRLAGALAYGWGFAKDPIAGVTPIANMLDQLGRPLRGREHTPVAEASNRATPGLRRASDEAVAARPASSSRPTSIDMGLPLPPRMSPIGQGALVRAALPLSVAGFGAAAFDALSRAFEDYHMTAIAAGGTAPARAVAPTRFEPGSAIAVNLVRGDMSVTGVGTVTYVDGDRLLAFGHPMFNLGEIYLPISTAEVHTVMAALSSSFKFASPLAEAGSLVQDRQAGVVASTATRSDMIPLAVHVRSDGNHAREFRAEVARHRFLTPLLATTVIANAAQEAASDVADATITLRTNLDIRGYPTLALLDHAYSTEGVSQKLVAAAHGTKAIGEILFNQFAPANLDRIDVEVDVDYRPNIAEITGISMRADEVEPGSRPGLVVTLRPYNGPEFSHIVAIDIPAKLAGKTLKIEAAAGNLVKPDVAPPETLGALLDNLRKSYGARSIVVSMQTPDQGLMLREKVVPDLPASVMDTLRPGASTRRGEAFKLAARMVVPMPSIVVGKRELQIKVKETVGR